MPPIKVQHVVSCSSEDKVHKSENILVSDHYRKWKCGTPGEKQATLILQLEKASIIYSVDIGNEGSAFVEVLVGRSSDSKQDFQVLIVTSSFMSPSDSRQGANTNRVRMFPNDKLSQTTAKEKWDLIKIVCTQPFNKSIQYGLSFIVFHSPPERNNTTDPLNKISSFGAFKLKLPDENDSPLTVGSLFARHKTNTQEVDPVTAPANIRSVATKHKTSDPDVGIMPKKMKPISLSKGDTDRENDSTVTKSKISLASTSKRDSSPETSQPSTSRPKGILQSALKSTNKESSTTPTSVKKDQKESLVKKTQIPPIASKNANRPFHKLMDGVTFVLSGYQNPQRGNIRDKAMELGAKYKADWDNSCTHLICAFANTPKFREVHKKGGRICNEKWILECYKQNKRLPWRQFMLGKSSHPQTSESEDSDGPVPMTKKAVNSTASTSVKDRPLTSSSGSKVTSTVSVKKRERVQSDEDENSTASTQRPSTSSSGSKVTSTISIKKRERAQSDEDENLMDSDEVYAAPTDVDSDSSCDTETEIAKVVSKQLSKNNGIDTKANTLDVQLPFLPDMFQNIHFFLYGDYDNQERKTLVRFIVGCCGVVDDYMTSKVKYVLTNSNWKSEFTDAIQKDNSIRILNPDWVLKCIQLRKIAPHADFLVRKV